VRLCIAKVPLGELEHVAGRPADLARDAVLTPVRFVKTIDARSEWAAVRDQIAVRSPAISA
jgi:hypothetical protein